ncbi:oxidoreductase [Streptomyces venezuelae ATCC 10712]|uniref:Oxidoreductase n=1 Tax=Streptomyces venezuelae (strain ATCC 10712 / CBS 650.69 / DSM 40230 / JCM 4526 / NBRC 13096 / PD 04745) TaxID=953739 RepID=F2RF24_STRVP|nr:hypothetical protein vnz_31685 [Streptomyces venezuelae]CCA59709.1 oxidoreductase [Streptomyces venezuelae ATCC 10712]
MPAAYTTLELAPATLPQGGDGDLPGSLRGSLSGSLSGPVPGARPGPLPGCFPPPRPGDVDLVVDGRPLLHRLDEADGTDAVSPLAGDLLPVLRAEHVRRLLGTAPSLPEGRQVIYSCPDCDELGCGAVTAVVERDGEDVVWRDFAWQTGPTVDPARDGYPGIGPYRFDGASYRAALHRLGTRPRTGARVA